jgi:hypothetical protein
VAASYKHCNELLGSIKCGAGLSHVLNLLNRSLVLKMKVPEQSDTQFQVERNEHES